MLSVAEKTAQIAEHIARHDAHGYSQNNRAGDGTTETVTLSDGSKVTIHGGDYDCSEMVRVCVNGALTGNYKKPIGFMYTGNEDEELLAQGFTRMVYSASKAQRGDVLWRSGHTGVALGGGRQAEAAIDENGGITGPKRGDQTGREVAVNPLSSWTRIYRAPGGSADAAPTPVACTYRVTVTTETNVRSAPSMSASVTGQLPPGYRLTCDGWLQAEGRYWATYVADSGRRRYVSLGTAHSWVAVS